MANTAIAATTTPIIIVVTNCVDDGLGVGEALAVGLGVGVGLGAELTVTVAAEEFTETPALSVTCARNDQAPKVAEPENKY